MIICGVRLAPYAKKIVSVFDFIEKTKAGNPLRSHSLWGMGVGLGCEG